MNQMAILLSAFFGCGNDTISASNYMLYLCAHMQMRIREICMLKAGHKWPKKHPHMYIYIHVCREINMSILWFALLHWNKMQLLLFRSSKNCCANILYTICIDILSYELSYCGQQVWLYTWVCEIVRERNRRTLNHGDCDFVVKVCI